MNVINIQPQTLQLYNLVLFWVRFLSMLEEEVYSHSSPIWSQDFLAGASGGQIPIHTGNTPIQAPQKHTNTLTGQASFVFFYPVMKCITFLPSQFSFCFSAVIAAPPVARPLYYSTSPVSVDTSNCGSVSPARKAASVLESNPVGKNRSASVI